MAASAIAIAYVAPVDVREGECPCATCFSALPRDVWARARVAATLLTSKCYPPAKPPQSHINATSMRVDSQAVATPKPPQSHHNASLMRPQSSHKAPTKHQQRHHGGNTEGSPSSAELSTLRSAHMEDGSTLPSSATEDGLRRTGTQNAEWSGNSGWRPSSPVCI